MRLVIFAAFMLLFGGCLCDTITCTPEGLGVVFRSYSEAELRGVVLRRYDTGSFYQQLMDSIAGDVWFNAGSPAKEGVVTNMALGGSSNWEVVMPAVGRSVRIYNIRNAHTEQKECSMYKSLAICTAPVAGFMQDGVLKKTQNTDTTALRLIIEK